MSKQVLIDKKNKSKLIVNTRDRIDLAVIKQIFIKGDYDLAIFDRYHDIKSNYEKICADGQTPLIIDCGANIGASCLYFAHKFPAAKIIGIEPEPDNFRLAAQNCASHSNIELIQGGIANTAGLAKINNPAAENWAFQTKLDNKGGLALVSVNDLLLTAAQNGQIPFLIKIDIEGFEENLFAANTQWIDLFYVLIIELHDWMLPKTANSHNFLNCIAPLGRGFVYRSENVFSIKN